MSDYRSRVGKMADYERLSGRHCISGLDTRLHALDHTGIPEQVCADRASASRMFASGQGCLAEAVQACVITVLDCNYDAACILAVMPAQLATRVCAGTRRGRVKTYADPVAPRARSAQREAGAPCIRGVACSLFMECQAQRAPHQVLVSCVMRGQLSCSRGAARQRLAGHTIVAAGACGSAAPAAASYTGRSVLLPPPP